MSETGIPILVKSLMGLLKFLVALIIVLFLAIGALIVYIARLQ